MIEIMKMDNSHVVNDDKMSEMLEGVVTDNVSVAVALQYLEKDVDMYGLLVKGSIIGYFSVDYNCVPGYVECHAYIYPESRRHSVKALKALTDFLHNLGHRIQTSVLGNFPHVLKLLKSIGFSITEVEDSAFTKNGISYPVFHLKSNP